MVPGQITKSLGALEVAVVFLLLLLAIPLRAQILPGVFNPVSGSVAVNPGWQYVQENAAYPSGTCASGSNSCNSGNPSFVPTVSGSVWVIAALTSSSDNYTISGISGGGATANIISGHPCHINNSTIGYNVDIAYATGGASGTSGSTPVTVTLSGTPANSWNWFILEELPPSGGTPSYDTCGTIADTSCTTSCAGVNLGTLGGTDGVSCFTYGYGASWNGNIYSAPYITDINGNGWYLNATSGSAPTINDEGGTGIIVSCLALKSSLGSFTPYTKTQTLVNYLSSTSAGGGSTFAATPSATLTIPSTGSGNLAYMKFGTESGQYVSSISGCGTWTVPSTYRYTQGGITLSTAYNLSLTSGCTSITVTMSSSNSAVSYAYMELNKTSGTWSVGNGCGPTSNAASYYPEGCTISSLGGTNNAIFACGAFPGGTSGNNVYPGPPNYLQFMQANASCVLLMNTNSTAPPSWVYQDDAATEVDSLSFY